MCNAQDTIFLPDLTHYGGEITELREKWYIFLAIFDNIQLIEFSLCIK